MNQIRTLLTYGVLAFITLGYLASQWAYLNQRHAEYAKAVDTPAFQTLSFLILTGSLVLAFIPSKEVEAE